MTEQLKPSSGRDWRKLREETTITTLAYCGMVVEIGHVQIDQLLLAGKIPDLLTPIVADVLWSQLSLGKSDAELSAEKSFFGLVNAVVTAALVNPRVVEHPTQDDEIAISDIDFGDKMVIYSIAKQPLAVLHRFRQEQGANVEPVQQGEDLQPPTERDTEAGERVAGVSVR